MRSRIPLLLLAAGAVAFGITLVLVLLSPQVRAGPPPPVTRLDVTALRESGRALTLVQRSVDGVDLVEPKPAGGGLKRPRPLAAAPDGMTLAISTVEPGRLGPLTLARADGSQLEVELPGVRGAAFEPGGAWLAVVDLTGALWRVDAVTGLSARQSDGPYAPDVSVLADGRILAVRQSAVDAPLWASAETIDSGGTITPMPGGLAIEAQLVYGATPLLDGSVALVRHKVGGGIAIVRLEASGETALASLDGVAGVAVSPDGNRLGWPAAEVTWLAPVADLGAAVAIGDGSPVRFSPDGSLLLVLGAEAAEILEVGGSHLDRAGPDACWVGGGRGCRP